jgi:hypothetical protein
LVITAALSGLALVRMSLIVTIKWYFLIKGTSIRLGKGSVVRLGSVGYVGLVRLG